LAKRSVSQRRRATVPMNQAGMSLSVLNAAANSSEARRLPASTVNITGLRSWWSGLSFAKLAATALRKRGHVIRGWGFFSV
jgi:hypothetical protein